MLHTSRIYLVVTQLDHERFQISHPGELFQPIPNFDQSNFCDIVVRKVKVQIFNSFKVTQ